MALGLKRWRPALILSLIALAAAVILAGLNELTGERIAREQQTRALSALTAMLPDGSYDNQLIDDVIEMPVAGLPEPASVYRARLGETPVAALIDLVTPRGYSGDIRLLVAVDPDATILGVRILEHRETPGLGDRIERRRSDWIEQFTGLGPGTPPPDAWAPDRRGGEFDTLTSATITVSAVIDAVHQAVQAAAGLEGELFATAHDPEATEITEDTD